MQKEELGKYTGKCIVTRFLVFLITDILEKKINQREKQN
jgi:hypothetical protein